MFLFIIVFGVSACTSNTEYLPEGKNLKKATIGIPYFSKIYILGGGVIGGNIAGIPEKKAGIVTPEDAGISLRHCQLPEWRIKNMKPKDSNNYNCIEIYGTPTKPGVITIEISGRMYGSMLASSKKFSKEYTIKVVTP
ncbi:hypothetical protein OH773_21655 [Buttiauxella sp. WJP83]|uniref:hypothetical protein n=1 Tax=Buttiauxella sp. WJP83 TaxID=2986951 RepID=UPI0022DCE953|nr:hypothetical protein [Buttiauxella sp. WJP83]WBM70678.1 hypothetical protein OH773_21655 [Buttiauxella sp. WJP83]